MRLWQKIFLLTLCLTALAADSVSLVLLVRNHGNSLSLAKERVRTICDGAVLEMGHLIQERKEEKGCIMLTEGEMEELTEGVGLDRNGQLFWKNPAGEAEAEGEAGENEIVITPVAKTALILGDEPGNAAAGSPDLTKNLSLNPGSVRTEYREDAGRIRIGMETTVFWEGRFYRVEVFSDLSELFGRFQEDIVFGQWMCGAVSLITAVFLLLSILYMTRPLKRLEAATKQIAAGEYGYRVRPKGHDEIAELSGYMNEMAAEIQDNIRRVEELAGERETFIANMAHELKTPLTSILGFADIMAIKSDMGEAERREYAAIIGAEAKRLQLLSSRLMELISIRETELVLAPVNLKELTERALEVMEPVCAGQQCSVRRELQPLQAEADEALFTSLILNLLDNALKASKPGQEIVVTLKESRGSAVLAVRDYGIGIPEEELDRVTEAFYMVDKARSRAKGGSGVGLALCRAIAEAHHGTLRIESREGRGTMVRAELPCRGKCPVTDW